MSTQEEKVLTPEIARDFYNRVVKAEDSTPEGVQQVADRIKGLGIDPAPFAQPASTAPSTPPEGLSRFDENGYVKGSYAADNPILTNRQREMSELLGRPVSRDEAKLAEELERFRGDAGRGSNAFRSREREDSFLRSKILGFIDRGREANAADPNEGLDVAESLRMLDSASSTNRLQRGGRLAGVFGMPENDLVRTRGGGIDKGPPVGMERVLGEGGAYQTGMDRFDHILHPEKYKDPKLVNLGDRYGVVNPGGSITDAPGGKIADDPAKPVVYSTTKGLERVNPDGTVTMLSENPAWQEESPAAGKPIRDSETGELIGHMVGDKFVKISSGASAVKVDAAELKRYTTRQAEIQNRLEDLDRERAAGNKKSGPDWWFPGRDNFGQERQRLESELAGIKAVLAGGGRRPEAGASRADAESRSAAPATPTPEQIRAELERRRAGR